MLREGRALLYALKRTGRSKKAIGKRILFLVDNMAVCLAFSRMRAKSFNLLVIVRKFAAWCLSRRIFPAIRWIPSERNSADAPSRYFDFLHHEEFKYVKKVVHSVGAQLEQSRAKRLGTNSICHDTVDCSTKSSKVECPQDPDEAAASDAAEGEGEGAPIALSAVVSKRSESEPVHSSNFQNSCIDSKQSPDSIDESIAAPDSSVAVDLVEPCVHKLELYQLLFGGSGEVVECSSCRDQSSIDGDGEKRIVLRLCEYLQPYEGNLFSDNHSAQNVVLDVSHAGQTCLDSLVDSLGCEGRTSSFYGASGQEVSDAPPGLGAELQASSFAQPRPADSAAEAWSTPPTFHFRRRSSGGALDAAGGRSAPQCCPFGRPGRASCRRVKHFRLGWRRCGLCCEGGGEPAEALEASSAGLLRRGHPVSDEGHEHFGGPSSGPSGPAELRQGPRQAHEVCRAGESEDAAGPRGGLDHCGLFCGVFPDGRAGPCWREDLGGLPGQVPGFQPLGEPEDAKEPQGVAGLAEIGAGSLADSSALGPLDGGGGAVVSAQGVPHGSVCVAQRRGLPASKRGLSLAEEGPHRAIRLYQLLGFGGESGGGRGGLEDAGVRRQLDGRLAVDPVPEAGVGFAQGGEAGGHGLSVPVRKVRRGAGHGMHRSAHSAHGALRNEALRAFPRPPDEGPNVAGGAKAGKMAERAQPRALREAHAHAPGLEQAPRRGKSTCREVSKGSRGVHARHPGGTTALAAPRHRRCVDRNKPVLDLFAGSSRVSRAVRRAGFSTKEWEILQGAQYDLTAPAVLRNVCREIREGVVACMLGPPCSSFSRARDRTRVIRTKRHPWGIRSPNLSDNDRKALKIGNACLKSALRIINVCIAAKTPFILENPLTSKMFLVPEVMRIMSHKDVRVVDVDFRQFGTAWKKPTKLVCGFIDEQDLRRLDRRCHAVGGVCSRTHKKHFQLTGTGPNGICWTRIAQPYPRKLATALAHCLLSNVRAEFMNKS